MKLLKSILLLSLFLIAFSACNPTRHVPDGKYLLVKNDIKADSTFLTKEQFEIFNKQKPNRKILGFFRFHLWVYNIGNSGKDTRFKRWLKSIGEEPVLVDSTLIERSAGQYRIFLEKNGFFNSVVTDSVMTKGKKATVTYHIKYNKPYTIRNITYQTLDNRINSFLPGFRKNSLIQTGQLYNEDLFEKERERITTALKDMGYYFFNRNYITYAADTSLNSHQVDIFLNINRINENIDPSVMYISPISDHHTYRINKIYIQTDYNPKNPALSTPKDTLLYNGYYMLSADSQLEMRYSQLVRNIYVESGSLYLQEKIDYTYKKLQDLNIFKFVNVYFKEVPRDSAQQEYLLDLNIQLTPTDQQDFTLEQETTNTGGNIGIAGSFGYRNKNTFKGAEVFQFKIKGGLEAIPNFNDSVEQKKFFFFNTYEIGPEISLDLRKLLLPPSIERHTSRYNNAKTSFNIGYNYQERPDYRRSVTNFSLNYSFSPTKNQRFVISPEINSIKVKLSPQFEAKLVDLNDPRLFYTYDTHIISSVRGSWLITNQKQGNGNFIFTRVNGEVAFPAFSEKLKPASFTKFDFDFSVHKVVNRYNNVVWRLNAGIGIPYGSSRALPFEKSFFAGGANSIRAWTARTLGPGSYLKSVNIEESGDIKIETNLEYRSEFLRLSSGIIWEAAAFIDVGNIWTRNADVSRPGGQFSKDALKELAVGGGVGLRFNFSFFILRFDAATKLRDPSLDAADRWVYPGQKFGLVDINYNLAIGYPF